MQQERGSARLIIGIGGWGTSTLALIFKHLGYQPNVRYIAIDTDRHIYQDQNVSDTDFQNFYNQVGRVSLFGEYGAWLVRWQHLYRGKFHERYFDEHREARGTGTEKEPQAAFILGLMNRNQISASIREAAEQLEATANVGDWDNVIITGGGGSAGRGLTVLTAALVQRNLRDYTNSAKMTVCAFGRDCYDVQQQIETDIAMNYIAFLRETQHFMNHPFSFPVPTSDNSSESLYASNFINTFIPFSSVSRSHLNTNVDLGTYAVQKDQLAEGLAIYLALASEPNLAHSIATLRTDLMRDNIRAGRRVIGCAAYQARLSPEVVGATLSFLKREYAKRLLNGVKTQQSNADYRDSIDNMKSWLISEAELSTRLTQTEQLFQRLQEGTDQLVAGSPIAGILRWTERGLTTIFDQIDAQVNQTLSLAEAEKCGLFPDSLQGISYQDGLIAGFKAEVDRLIQAQNGLGLLIDAVDTVAQGMRIERGLADSQIQDQLRAKLKQLQPRREGAMDEVSRAINDAIYHKLRSAIRNRLWQLYEPVLEQMDSLLENLEAMNRRLELVSRTQIEIPQSQEGNCVFDRQVEPPDLESTPQFLQMNPEKLSTLTLPILFNERGFNESVLWNYLELDSQVQAAELLTEDSVISELLKMGAQLNYRDLERMVIRQKYLGMPQSAEHRIPGVQHVRSTGNNKVFYVVEDYGLKLSNLRETAILEERLHQLEDSALHYIHSEVHELAEDLHPRVRDREDLFTAATLFGFEPPRDDTTNQEYPPELAETIAEDAIIQKTARGLWIVLGLRPTEDPIELGASFEEAVREFMANEDAARRVNRFLRDVENDPEKKRQLQSDIDDHIRVLGKAIRQAQLSDDVKEQSLVNTWKTMIEHLEKYRTQRLG